MPEYNGSSRDAKRRHDFVTVVQQPANSAPKPKSYLDNIEQWAKILSTAAIPLLIAFFGSGIQKSMQSEQLKRDYVQLAIGIIRDSTSTEEVRGWAVKLLDKNSPVPISAPAAKQLRQQLSKYEQEMRNLQNERDVAVTRAGQSETVYDSLLEVKEKEINMLKRENNILKRQAASLKLRAKEIIIEK